MEDRKDSTGTQRAGPGPSGEGASTGERHATPERENAPAQGEAQEGTLREEKRGLGALQVVGSVFAAGLGVQSSRNRERDFRQGRAGTFIAAGIIFTALFIGAVLTVVKLVLAGAD